MYSQHDPAANSGLAKGDVSTEQRQRRATTWPIALAT